MALFLIIENMSLAAYPDVCAAGMMYTTVPATVANSDGQMVGKSIHYWSCRVDSGLIPSRVKPMTLKLVFTAFLLDAQH